MEFFMETKIMSDAITTLVQKFGHRQHNEFNKLMVCFTIYWNSYTMTDTAGSGQTATSGAIWSGPAGAVWSGPAHSFIYLFIFN